ncbi:MAG: archaellin/type IV pilin N-terminal domain-containing protein [Nitrososphaerota archaeon]
MWWKTQVRRKMSRRGLTGLETAIILIAFVIVAAAFAFAVLNLGFASTQKSGEVLKAGLEEATSSIELAGSVIATGEKASDNNMKVSNITLYVKTAVGKRPVDLSNNTLIISYMDPYKVVDKLTHGVQVEVSEIQGDGDSLIEYGESFKVVIHVDQIYGGIDNVQLKPNDVFVIEVKPLVGAVLKVERRIPPSIDPVMDLA